MIMSHIHLSMSNSRMRPVETIAISSELLDTVMSLSSGSASEKSSVKDELNSSTVLSTRDKKHSASDDKTSALRFTPSQLHKVQKKRRDDVPKSLLKRKTYHTPFVEALESCGSREEYRKSPSRSSTSDRDCDLKSSRKSSLSHVTQESHRSIHYSEQDSDSGLETYRSRENYNRSPVRSSFNSGRRLVSYGKSENGPDSDGDEAVNASIYVTPEGTPVSMKSKEAAERQHSRFKRSLSDDYNDESPSAHSSFNNSLFYSPESSPSRFNPAKKLKTRWSDTSTYSPNNSSYSSWRHNASYLSEQGVQPELIGYQMVGDSQFCRFGQQLLGLVREPMPNCPGKIGICVSGQTITDLHRRVKDNFYPISDKIILMIGTNDFLRNVDVSTMCQELSALIKTLQKSASHIILLTLPPIPKLEKKSSTLHFKLLDAYNSHIRSLENGENLRIADVSPLYMTSPPYQRCKMHLFEVFFGGPAKRLDLIHLNRLGLDIIRKYILDKFL